jgi:hypothetical protein
VFQGAIGRSASARAGSGTTRSASMPMTRPKPSHSGQAPSGELNENSAGVGTRRAVPQAAQTSSGP